MGASACRAAAGLVTVAVLAVAAGCGSDGVPPKTWAKHVCQALRPWTASISDLTPRTQQEMTKVTTPGQAKSSIVTLLDSEARASSRARDKLLAAGVPDVDNGKKVAHQFAAALSSATHAYHTAANQVRKLPTSDATAFYHGVTKAIGALNRQYNAGALDTDQVRSTELQQAFDEVPECR